MVVCPMLVGGRILRLLVENGVALFREALFDHCPQFIGAAFWNPIAAGNIVRSSERRGDYDGSADISHI